MTEVRLGYKQTEVGVIPEDWDTKALIGLNPFITSGSRGWAKYYSEDGGVFVRITNLSRDKIYPDLSDLKFVKIPDGDVEAERTGLQTGDILVSITADIGIIGYVSGQVPRPAYINQHIACVRLPLNEVDTKFVSYSLSSQPARDRFRAITDAGAKTGINLTAVGQLKVPLPPLPEQQAIAEALGDADVLIVGLEALIAKKRDIKQGAMQELLTGQRRLPGFEGEWTLSLLGAIVTMKSGTSITATQIEEMHAFRCYGGNGLRGYADRYTHDGEFILIGRQGALCGNITQVSGRFFASEHAIVVTCGPACCPDFLAPILERMNLNRLSESSAQPGLSTQKLLQLDCKIPPTLDEQRAIATVLSDMDADIAALESKLAKARAVKQGMMQVLLTGEIRLV
jgi:type I restriction enzyme, S subunit